MKYENVCKGNFIDRPNRFIAKVDISGETVFAHVKNTGRCRELLVPGAVVFLEDHQGRMGSRKLRYSLIGVEKESIENVSGGKEMLLVNMDSQAPNEVVAEALTLNRLPLPGMTQPIRFRREQTYEDSRLDFMVEDGLGRIGYVEVKGVTLEEGRQARFPDAPTIRGRKHVEALERAVMEGYVGYVIFVIQMPGMASFRPNDKMDPAFGEALRKANHTGVKVLAYDCWVTEFSLELDQPVPVEFPMIVSVGGNDILG